MSSIHHHQRSANERNIEELQDDTLHWDKLYQENTDEIFFLKSLLTADVFQTNIPNLYEHLQEFYNDLIILKEEKIELHQKLRHHKNDLGGMMECDDIGCETFYQSQHKRLAEQVKNYLVKFKALKMEILKFTAPLLRKND